MAASIALNLGPVESIPYLKNQERLTCGRLGVIDPVNLDDYRAHGGYEGLKNALPMEPAAIVKAVTDSGLRGRGGAAFPDRHQVEDGARCAGAAEVHRLQRR